MRINTSISSRTLQPVSLAPGDMFAGYRVAVFLGEAEIYDMHNMRRCIQPHNKIVRFNIPMNKMVIMKMLESGHHLDANH
mmetsp:Transcript_17935/g.28562  ORF Transcript_17935/g.28562 Transcript_17935/m.28562 type:complete len:80 (+) Transcript_17935:439-678(+)